MQKYQHLYPVSQVAESPRALGVTVPHWGRHRLARPACTRDVGKGATLRSLSTMVQEGAPCAPQAPRACTCLS